MFFRLIVVIGVVVCNLVFGADSTYFTVDENTVALWRFNEGSGNVLYDESGNSHHGVLSPGIEREAGKYGGSVNIVNDNQYISVPNVLTFNNSHRFKIEAIVNFPAYNSNVTYPIFEVSQNGINDSLAIAFCVGVDYEKVLALATYGIYGNGLNATTTRIKAPLNDDFFNKWVKVGAEYDNGIRKLFINDSLVAIDTVSPITKFPGQYVTLIGNDMHNASSWYFAGFIDEIKISGLKNETNYFAVDSNTKALWRFNEQSGTIIVDESGNNNNGIISQGVLRDTGKYDGSVYIGHDSEYISVPNVLTLDNSHRFKIEAVVNFPSYNSNATYPIFMTSQNGINDSLAIAFCVGIDHEKVLSLVTYGLYGNDLNTTTSRIKAPLNNDFFNKWVEVGAEYDNGIRKLFINDSLIAIDTVSPITKFPGQCVTLIGNDMHNADSWRFEGFIDEIKVSTMVPTWNSQLPVFISRPDTVMYEGRQFTYIIKTSNPDKDSITLSLNINPMLNLELNHDTLIFKPDSDQIGLHVISIMASDKDNHCSVQTFILEVKRRSSGIGFVTLLPTNDTTITETDTLYFKAIAESKNTSYIPVYQWQIDGTIISNSSLCTLRTDYRSSGLHIVKVTAFANSEFIDHEWRITVNNRICKPSIVSPVSEGIVTGDSSFSWSFEDPDFDSLSTYYKIQFYKGINGDTLIGSVDSINATRILLSDLVKFISLPLKRMLSWKIMAFKKGSESPFSNIQWFFIDQIISVENVSDALPIEYSLQQNYPNPFNPSTSIKFAIPASSGNLKEQANIEIFSTKGELVRKFILKDLEPGYHTINWNGYDMLGRICPNGLYFYRIQSGTFFKTMRMIFLK